MLAAATDPGLLATDLAEHLVRKGVPFRTAHHRVGALVRYAGEAGKKLNELSSEEMLSVIPEFDDSMKDVFQSPVTAVENRDIFGATGYKQVASQLEFWKKHLSEDSVQ